MKNVRTAFLAGLACLALLVGLTAPSFADKEDDLKKQKRDLNGKIDDAKDEAEHSSKELKKAQEALKKAKGALAAAEGDLSRTRGELAVAQQRDVEMQGRLNDAETALATSIEQLEKGEKDLAKAEDAVAEFTLQSLQEGDSGLLAFNDLLSGESPESFTEQMSINESVSEAQVAKMQDLDAARIVLKLKRDEVRTLRDQVKVARQEAAANLKTQQALEAQAKAQADQVGVLVNARAAAEGDANKAAKADQALLAALESDRNRVESQLAALAEKDVASGGKGVGGDSGGALSYPVNSYITSRYGMRRHPITGVYKLHDGTDFGASCGTPIKAAASGTIIEQYYNGGYGNRIILNNGVKKGKSIVTTYNHLSRFRYSTGKKVERGQVIGYVGTTGYSTGCHLHFMVLENGRTTNPMNWL